MNMTIALLHLWSVVIGLLWYALLRKGAIALLPGPGMGGLGSFLGGSFAALFVFVLAFGSPLPWLLVDVYGSAPFGNYLATALFEEGVKAGLFLLLLYGRGVTVSLRAGALDASLIAFGFAVTQNGFYFLRYPELEMIFRPFLVTGTQMAIAAFWGGLLTHAVHSRGVRRVVKRLPLPRLSDRARIGASIHPKLR